MYHPITNSFKKSISNKTKQTIMKATKNKAVSKDVEVVFDEETQLSVIQYLKDENVNIPTDEILLIEEQINNAKYSKLESNAINSIVFAEGLKFGHLIKQSIGGVWSYDLKKHPYPFITVSDSFTINPIAKAYKFYTHGETESLLTMYLSMLFLISNRNAN